MRFSIGIDAQGMHCPDLQVWDDVIGRRRDTNEGKGQWRNPEKPASRRLDKRIADLRGQSQFYQRHNVYRVNSRFRSSLYTQQHTKP